MAKLYFIILTLLISNIHVKAQLPEKSIFTGIVLDAILNVPLEGAIVKIKASNEIALTNARGQFYLKQIPLPSDSIILSAIGYEEKTISFKELTDQYKAFLEQKEIQLQEMIVVAGRSNPSQIISKLDIKLRGINNSQEVLRIVPGLFIGQHAGGGKAEQIFLRGFDIDHGTDINIAVDGMPVNMVSHAHGQGYADLHFVIPELIEEVQFNKGTYDPGKGNFTTAGFVDFRTKNRLKENSIKVEAGQFNTIRSVALLNLMQKETKNMYVAGEYMYTKGYFDHPQHFNRVNLLTKYNSKIGSNNELTVTASVFKSRWDASGQIPDRAVADGSISFFGAIDPNEGGNTSRSNLNTQLITTINSSSYIKNQLYYTYYDFDLFSNFTFFLADPVNGDQIRQKEKRSLFGYNGSYHHTQYVGNKMLTSEAGIQLRLDKTKESELSRTKDRKEVLSNIQFGNIKEANAAVYVNEKIRWNNFFSASAGIRLDHFNLNYTDKLNQNVLLKTNAAIVSPKLNLFFHPTTKMEVYLSAGKGFHSNDTRVALERRGQAPLPAAYGMDLGLNAKLSKKLFVNAAIWQLFLDQEFVYVGDEGIVEPGGKTVRKGVDLTIRYQPFNKLFIDADIAYAYARNADAPKKENFIPLAPKFTSSGGLMYKTEEGWNGSLRYRFMSDRPANEDYSLTAKGYFVTDAVLGYTKQKFEITLAAQNIFNVRWKETQFETESRLLNEAASVSEIHFTPGTPLFIKAGFTYLF